MGFDPPAAAAALDRAGGDVAAALQTLLGAPEAVEHSIRPRGAVTSVRVTKPEWPPLPVRTAQCGRPSEPSYLIAFRPSPRSISQQTKDTDPARWESSVAAQTPRRRNGSRLP